ncbi:MAG: hypothetical protein JRJ65_19385 [Deltaproteobacteria bacterium]|nr:hypothetical protein [Deltaproteobacteria bacterium]
MFLVNCSVIVGSVLWIEVKDPFFYGDETWNAFFDLSPLNTGSLTRVEHPATAITPLRTV